MDKKEEVVKPEDKVTQNRRDFIKQVLSLGSIYDHSRHVLGRGFVAAIV
jgi:hypothetical protein